MWEEWTSELQSPVLPLLLPSPNQVNDHGPNRDCWVLNPAASSAKELEFFEFLGKLMGCSIRNKLCISLSLAPFVWKVLVNDEITADDIFNVDEVQGNILTRLLHDENINRDNFSDLFPDLTFVGNSVSGAEVELIPGGASTAVTWENRGDYVRRVIEMRVQESRIQLEALRRGLGTIVPQNLLSLFQWDELELMVCGSKTMDVDMLRRHTEYQGFSENDPTIQYFWQVLNTMDAAEHQAFLRFTWGRSRLPVRESDWRRPMKIAQQGGGSPDHRMPVSHTCFFKIDLPAYTNPESLAEKIRYAIFNCRAIDGDDTGTGMAAAAMGWDDADDEDDVEGEKKSN